MAFLGPIRFLAAAARLALGVATCLAALVPPGSAHATSASAAQRIYSGTYFERGASGTPRALFTYERWSRASGQWLRSTHLHRTPSGAVVVRQSALHSTRYGLESFEYEQRQKGVVGRARRLEPRRVVVERTVQGRREERSIEHDHPLVVGPTLYGTLLSRWNDIASGKALTLDFLSVERLDTYAFEVRLQGKTATTTTFSIRPASALISLFVSPLEVVFDSRTHLVRRYQGPVPALMLRNGELESFDARIEYESHAAAFR